MSAAAQPEIVGPTKSMVTPEPLPWSKRPVAPDRGDWEFLLRAVGVVRVRPTPAPPTQAPSA